MADYKELKRNFILSEDVTESSVKLIIEEIIKINKFDNKQDSTQKEYKREPIELIVNTDGGSVYDGFALVAAIQQSKTLVHTFCLGKAMSMGLMIFVAGHKRFMHPLGTLMYHQVSSSGWGKINEIKQNIKQMERVEIMYDKFVLSKTNIRKKDLEEIKSTKKEWYIDAFEAKKLNIVDVILGE